LRARALGGIRDDPAVERVEAGGATWLRPAGEGDVEVAPRVRFLAPFDPIVWDRPRFERFWGWDYRFEAYTPAAGRRFGYYALPLLWRDEVIGWVNASMRDGALTVAPGYVRKPPAHRGYRRELEAEVERMGWFLGAARATLSRAARP
jgi:uncharacterized protein YcaQ